MSEFYVRWPSTGGGGGGGVTSLNGETGSLTLTGTNGITITPSGSTIAIGNSNAVFTPGNLTDVGTDGIVITGGTNAVNGAGTSISQHVADSTHNGYLSSVDWSTFNGKQPAGNYANTALSNLVITSINTSLLPSADNTFAIGSTLLRWDDLHTTNATIGNLTVDNFVFSDLTPTTTNTYNLGSSSRYWTNIYVQNINSSAALSITSTSININSVQIHNVIDPTSSQDAATKNYVDTHSSTGTVTSVSIVSANGLAGTVATATTTPAITLSTTVTGILQGNGTAISAATTGNLTDVGTDGIVVIGGTGAVLGSGTSLAQHVADTTHNGYLSSTDWNTFNTSAGAAVTSLTGDVTGTGPGATSTSLVATTNSTLTTLSSLSLPGAQLTGNISGNAGNVTGVVAVANGGTSLATLTANNVILGNGTSAPLFVAPGTSGNILTSNGTTWTSTTPAASGITQLTGDVTAGPGSGSQAATLATVNGNVGTFGSSTSIPAFTVNAKGLITAASGNVVVAPAGTLTGTTLASNVVTSSLTSVGTITSGTWNGTTIAVANGGTSLTALTANNVILGNGTSAPLFVAPGTVGNILIDNGTTWVSSPAPGTISIPQIGARYFSSTSTITSSLGSVVYNTKDFDVPTSYSAGTYTVPTTGFYEINVTLLVTGTISLNNTLVLQILKNGTAISSNSQFAAGAASDLEASVSDILSLTAGDTITIQASCSAVLPTIVASNTNNYFSIVLVGNPGVPRSEVCVTVGNGSGSTNTYVRRWTNSTNGTNGAVQIGTAIIYADSVSLGATFTINETGIYSLSYDESQSIADQFGISKNQSTLTQAYSQLPLSEQVAGSSTPGVNAGAVTSVVLNLTAGDVIRGLWGNDGEGATYFQKFRITKINN